MTDIDGSNTSESTTNESTSVIAQSDAALPWPKLIALACAAFATVTMEMLPSGLLPQIGRGLGVDPAVVGTLVTAWALTIVVTGIPLVRITRKARRARLIPTALGVVAVAGAATAFAPTFEIALLGRVIAAAGHGVLVAVIVVYVSDIVASERVGRAMAIVLAGPTIAGFVGLPLGTALADVVGWRAIFAGASVVLAVIAIALVPILADTGGSAVTADGATAARWDRSAIPSVGTALAGAVVLVGHFVVFTFVSLVVTEVAQYQSTALAWFLALFGAAGAVGLALSAWLSDRWPRATLPAVALAMFAAFALLTIAPTMPVVFVTAIVVWGTAIGLLPPVFQVRVVRLASAQFRSLAGAVAITLLNLGVAAGAALGSLVAGSSTGALAPVAMVVTAVGTVGLLLLGRVREARAGDTRTPNSAATDEGGGGPAPTTTPVSNPLRRDSVRQRGETVAFEVGERETCGFEQCR
ncbi:MFS transporter [Rhodococcus sp. NPDC058639]|uniref:MFS transporter n=1 Tax=Rhodococcus sp. NPDC058639 TaxID=3346570 RepID=UPI00366A18D3